MNEHFLTYEQSLAVKELGFIEPCLALYFTKNPLYNYDIGELCYSQEGGFWEDFNLQDDRVSAPLKSQFFKWVREKKLSDSCICRYQSRDDGGVYYYYVINHDFGVEETKHFKEGFYSYEEAEDACINKIIELLKLK